MICRCQYDALNIFARTSASWDFFYSFEKPKPIWREKLGDWLPLTMPIKAVFRKALS